VDLVYFVNPWHRAMLLQKLNYIFTVLDLCHRDFPEFPEVRVFGEFEVRENMYKAILPKAYLTLVDSPELKERIQYRYGLDPDRVLAMPFQPSSLFQSNGHGSNGTVSPYQLGAGYLFYPAQFWSHKGHRRLLQALMLLRKNTGDCPVCVFAGDGANLRDRLEQESVSLGLADRVRFLGFVPSDHLEPLYRNARALVMPTYFGPTNLPPLEAWTLGIPVIYPNHLRSHTGDGAIYFEADSAESLAMAISQLDKHGCHQAQVDGRARLQELAEIRKTAEIKLGRALEVFAARRALWA
jgi:glycosyltransferase involved in cell wall biosynthesis